MRAPHLLICACLLWSCSAVVQPSEPEQVHGENPPTWFEDGKSLLSISDDGRWAVYRGRRRVELIDLQYGARDPWRLFGTLDEVVDARFYGGGRLARSGRRGEANRIRAARRPARRIFGSVRRPARESARARATGSGR